MTTKREARAASAAWRLALAEGRVLRIKEIPDTLASYPTTEALEGAVRQAVALELTPEIVKVPA